MARRRFFVSEVRRDSAELIGSDAEHLVRVLRVEPGQVYELSDNCNVYLAEVESARKSRVSFRLVEHLPAAPPLVHITILTALIKFERFEWLVEKATELGVSVIQPIEAVRTERGLAQAAPKRSERWKRIALEASQQSRRAHLPEIARVLKFEAAIATPAGFRLLLDEQPDAPPILRALPVAPTQQDRIGILLGPEGGWTDEERQRAVAAGWISCSLGSNILRAETAALSVLAVVQAVWQTAKFTPTSKPPRREPADLPPATS